MVYTNCDWKVQLIFKDKDRQIKSGKLAIKRRYRGNSGLTRYYYRFQHFGKRTRKKHFTDNAGIRCFECGN